MMENIDKKIINYALDDLKKQKFIKTDDNIEVRHFSKATSLDLSNFEMYLKIHLNTELAKIIANNIKKTNIPVSFSNILMRDGNEQYILHTMNIEINSYQKKILLFEFIIYPYDPDNKINKMVSKPKVKYDINDLYGDDMDE